MLRYLNIVLGFSLLLAVSACSWTNRQPRYDVPAPLEIEPFKRYARTPNVDYMANWSRKAYKVVHDPIEKRLSPSQRDLLERHGQPDYVRETFRATTGEIVEEWVWWDRSIVAQFVQRELVYEGELTDMDRTRVRHGNPRRAWQQEYEEGVRRDIWVYQDVLFSPRGVIVTFSDGKLVSQQEY